MLLYLPQHSCHSICHCSGQMYWRLNPCVLLAITCCVCMATNGEAITGGSIANREETLSVKSLCTIQVSKAHFELSAFCTWSQAVNVQAQPVFTFKVTKAIAGQLQYVEIDNLSFHCWCNPAEKASQDAYIKPGQAVVTVADILCEGGGQNSHGYR